MKKLPGPLVVCLSGFLLGVLIIVFGLAEVGRGELYYYVLSLIIAGALAALPSPRWFLLAPLAIFAGQVVYGSIGHPIGDGYWVAGLICGAMYNLASLPGALFIFAVWFLRRKENAR